MPNTTNYTQSDLINLMVSCPLFKHLSIEQILALVNRARIVTVKERKIFFQQGQTASEFYLIIRGDIKLALISRMGQEKILHLLHPGDTFAEALMFLEKPTYPATATALSSCTVLAFPNELYRSIISKSPDACFRVLGEYSIRIRRLVNEIEFLATHNATHRVIRYLLDEIPRSHHGSTTVELNVPKHAIASRLSITPETLSRILAKLKRDGMINISEKHICLRDTESMRKLVSKT